MGSAGDPAMLVVGIYSRWLNFLAPTQDNADRQNGSLSMRVSNMHDSQCVELKSTRLPETKEYRSLLAKNED